MSSMKDEAAVYGYIRRNFDEKCLIDQLVKRIIQFYVNNGGSLYVFGREDDNCGCLGLKNKHWAKKPTICAPFDQNNALLVAIGTRHTLILDMDNNVWSCGQGKRGQLGNGQIENVHVPTQLNLNHRVISLCAGSAHSLLLCDNGWVQSFGKNTFGQLGHGNLKNSLAPKTIEKLKKYNVVQICTGLDYSAALTEDGELLCFGQNRFGQCGIEGRKNKIKIPTKVELKHKIAFIACGYAHSLFLTRKGLIYSCGDGSNGKLGHEMYSNDKTPKLIQIRKMKTCAAGNDHSICIDKKGIPWAFGSNRSGQCGFENTHKELKQAPKKNQLNDSYGQHGLSMNINPKPPLPKPKIIVWFIENKIKAKRCAAGGNQSCVIAEDGSLYMFGDNDYLQLALGGKPYQGNIYIPTKLLKPHNGLVQNVSMGQYHTAVICNTNTI